MPLRLLKQDITPRCTHEGKGLKHREPSVYGMKRTVKSVKQILPLSVESTLTDAKIGSIIRNIISPEFRKGNYGSGILQGVKTIAGYVLQDEALMQRFNSTDENFLLPGILAFVLLFLIFACPIMLVCLIIKLRFRDSYTSYFSGSNKNYTSAPGRSYSSSSGRSYSSGGGYSCGDGSFGGGGASGGW